MRSKDQQEYYKMVSVNFVYDLVFMTKREV